MKYFLLLSATLIAMTLTLPGCATQPTTTTPKLEVIPGTVVSVPDKPVESTKKIPLAWGPDHPEWDKALYDAIAEIKSDKEIDLIIPCSSKTHPVECVAQLISIMAKYESDFNPDASYKEGFSDADGPVISRGLLQISQLSANQKAYGCNIKNAKDLHDPKVNLKCAVKIISYQAMKSGTLIGEPKKGCAAYWSVCRQSSGSYKKIMKYMGQF